MKTAQDSMKLALDLFLNKLAGKYAKYLPGQTIFAEGEEGTTMFLVLAGRVRILKKSSDGSKLRVIATREAGEFIGEMALVESSPRSATVEAEDACEVLEFNRTDFEKAIQEQPSLAVKVLRSLSRKLRESDERQVRVLEEANRLLSESNRELIGLNSFLDCIIDQTPSAVVLVASKGDIFRINNAGRVMFELDLATETQNVQELFVGFSFNEIRKNLCDTWTGQVTGRRNDKPFPVILSIRPLSGHPDGILYLLICQDISDLEERTHAAIDYERFLAAQQAVVEMAHGTGRILTELQDHIDGLAELIPEERRSAMSDIIDATDSLSARIMRMAEDFLINRSNSNEFSFVDLRAMLHAVSQGIEAISRYDAIDFRYSISDDFPRKLLLRAGQVQSVLYNVMALAAEELSGVPEDREPQVSVELSYEPDDRIALVRVSSNGNTVTDEYVEDLLQAGLSSYPNDHRLGLGTVRTIVELHGGRLIAKARRLGGVAVEVRLPLRQTAGDDA